MKKDKTLPENWKVKRFEEIFDVQIGGTPKRAVEKYWDKDKQTKNLWVSISDMSGVKGKYILDTSEYISDLGIENSNVKPVPEGTILLSFKLTLGRLVIAGKPLFTNEAIAALHIKSAKISRDFLYYALHEVDYYEEVDKAVKGATLNKDKLGRLKVKIPGCLEQQRKIAAILSSLDETIEKTQAVIDQLQVLKRGLMQQLFTRGVPGWHSDFRHSVIGEFPSTWSLTTLGELCGKDGLQTGPFGSQLKAEEYSEEGIPVVMPVNMGSGKIFEEGIARVPQLVVKRLTKHQVQTGDILFGRRGDIGRFGLVTDTEQGWLCGTGCLRARPSNEAENIYLASYLSKPEVSSWLIENAVGQTMLNLNTSILAELPILVPSKKEQLMIASSFTLLNHQIESEKVKKSQLEQIKRGLMQQLLSGQMLVKV